MTNAELSGIIEEVEQYVCRDDHEHCCSPDAGRVLLLCRELRSRLYVQQVSPQQVYADLHELLVLLADTLRTASNT